MRPQWVDVVRLRGKWNICLHLQKTYEHQTRQGLDILWGAITLNFAWHLISWSMLRHVTVWKIYISTFTGLIATKPGRMITSVRRLSAQPLSPSLTSCCFVLLYSFHFITYKHLINRVIELFLISIVDLSKWVL